MSLFAIEENDCKSEPMAFLTIQINGYQDPISNVKRIFNAFAFIISVILLLGQVDDRWMI